MQNDTVRIVGRGDGVVTRSTRPDRYAQQLWSVLRKKDKKTFRFYPWLMTEKEADAWWRRNQRVVPDQVRQIAVVMEVYAQRAPRGLAPDGRRGRPKKFSELDLQLIAFVLSVLDNATGRESKPGHPLSATATLVLARAVLEIVDHPHHSAVRALNVAISEARKLRPDSIFV